MNTEQKTHFTPADWTVEDRNRAIAIWEEYQSTHDVSDRKGQAAGIDPKTGDVWFGESIVTIAEERERKGLYSPLFFVRVGSPAYYRKGSHR
jgi:hypothetical protein